MSGTVHIAERAESRVDDGAPSTTLTLPFVARQKSRQRAVLDDGRGAMLMLPRGTVLRGGDRLRGSDGTIVLVRAAPEPVSTARASDEVALARAAYHLGNRHVPLQIGERWLRYEHDHVLDAMVRGLGLEVSAEEQPFEPEGGAYGGGHAHAGDAHHHDHPRSHEHRHPHEHPRDDGRDAHER